MTDVADLQKVNIEVNAIPFNEIPSTAEPGDLWKDTPDGGTWVCRDYVVRKAERLQERGCPPSAMTVVLCWDELNEYHAVLAVDLDGPPASPWILDSRYSNIYRMADPPTGYRWDRRQVAGTTEFTPVA